MQTITDDYPRPAATADTPPFDFVSGYADYADIVEAPRLMHEIVGIQLIATILNKNGVCIQLGGVRSSLDLWTVLLSGSGAGRSTLVTLAGPILEAAELIDVVRSATWGSAQALYQYLADRPNGLFVWGELSEKLRLLGDIRFQGAKEWITDRYDNLRVPESITYRATGIRGRDTPAIEFREAPRINVLATSSEDWFFSSLLTEDSTGGFLPRWLLIRPNSDGRVIPIPRTPDPDAVPQLASHLRRVDTISGDADISLIEAEYESWYREATTRFRAQDHQSLAAAYFNRHRIHILKLAVGYEVSSSLSLRVSQASWIRAVEFARLLEATIFSLLSTGMNSSGYKRRQMEERVRDAEVEGLTLSEFTRAFQHTDKRERDGSLNTLVISETIYAFSRTTAGRTAKYLVHRDFAESYRSGNSEDSPVQVTYGRR
jgi:energy-coupling factor transporter ATP-binding protein EcfA2